MNRRNLESLPKDLEGRFIEFIEENLKGENISNQIHYSIWYNIETDELFEVVQASSNWAWQDNSHLLCLFTLNNGIYFNKEELVSQSIEALGMEEFIDDWGDEVNLPYDKLNALKNIRYPDYETIQLLYEALSKDTKEEVSDLMWDQEKEWIIDEFRNRILHEKKQNEFEDTFQNLIK